ncbi:hypothetical protein ES703_120356 [subsurface metagenome]
MAQEIAFAAPGTEQMTRVVTIGVGAGFTGAVEGVVISMAPKLGALEPVFTWGALLGVPAVGAGAALFTRGMLSDLALGVAAGGCAVLGYTLPAMLQEFTLAKAPRASSGGSVKLLGAGGLLGAPQRAQQAARLNAGQLPANAGLIPILQDEGILV